MNSKLFVILIMAAFGSEENENAENEPNFGENKITENSVVVKIEETECVKKTCTSEYIGVSNKSSKWSVQRWSRNESKLVSNGCYANEETAAHASDTLARQLMERGEQGHRLNFPDDDTVVHKKKNTSEYVGVAYNRKKWRVQRSSRNENKLVSNGGYDNEETAAHASDTLARQLMENGEQHKLNFPHDNTVVHKKIATSEYIGVAYSKRRSKWRVWRWSKHESNLVEKGEQGHKLNFPTDDTVVHPECQKKEKKKTGIFPGQLSSQIIKVRISKKNYKNDLLHKTNSEQNQTNTA